MRCVIGIAGGAEEVRWCWGKLEELHGVAVAAQPGDVPRCVAGDARALLPDHRASDKIALPPSFRIVLHLRGAPAYLWLSLGQLAAAASGLRMGYGFVPNPVLWSPIRSLHILGLRD